MSIHAYRRRPRARPNYRRPWPCQGPPGSGSLSSPAFQASVSSDRRVTPAHCAYAFVCLKLGCPERRPCGRFTIYCFVPVVVATGTLDGLREARHVRDTRVQSPRCWCFLASASGWCARTRPVPGRAPSSATSAPPTRGLRIFLGDIHVAARMIGCSLSAIDQIAPEVRAAGAGVAGWLPVAHGIVEGGGPAKGRFS